MLERLRSRRTFRPLRPTSKGVPEIIMKWRSVSLRGRILLIVAALVISALAGGLVTMQYIYWLGSVLTSMVDRDVAAFKAAEELESALVIQKGFLTYFIQDGDPDWLRQLDEHRNAFSEWLKRARVSSQLDRAQAVLDQIETQYVDYDQGRGQVIRLYEAERETKQRNSIGK